MLGIIVKPKPFEELLRVVNDDHVLEEGPKNWVVHINKTICEFDLKGAIWSSSKIPLIIIV